jgi:hypothetical protein
MQQGHREQYTAPPTYIDFLYLLNIYVFYRTTRAWSYSGQCPVIPTLSDYLQILFLHVQALLHIDRVTGTIDAYFHRNCGTVLNTQSTSLAKESVGRLASLELDYSNRTAETVHSILLESWGGRIVHKFNCNNV